MASRTAGSPVSIALVDDYDVVVAGVAHMLAGYRDRVVVAELDSNQPVDDVVDIARPHSGGIPGRKYPAPCTAPSMG